MKTHLPLALAAVITFTVLPVTTAAAHTTCALPVFGPGANYHPRIVPSQFTANVTNPWYPLKVGRALIYTGVREDQNALDIVITTPRTKVIDGVRVRVVSDRLYLDGVLSERTSDYFAQDRCGNVWYFGEDTAELDAHGHVVSREGSFHAGVDGAQPGVFMQATPQLGRKFRQEWYAGHAEDVFQVVARNTAVTVPLGTFHHALRTAETTRLEPDTLDNKYYVHGIGEVTEQAVKGPTEVLRLVAIIP
ncbi:hypothetical protein ACQPYH_11795 [Kribbella sp. CA-245084]|uniref:hypothetical protein n=1 Tax=Kribbella sp. CA-245084 TaxID=3239940 RepID=UPI003D8BD40F